MRINTNSLAFRLTGAAAAVSLVLLLAAGLLLANLFKTAMEHNFDARLEAVLDALLANVELQDGLPVIQGALADTRFTIPYSGWYWQVTPRDGNPQRSLASSSLLDQHLTPDPALLASRGPKGEARFYLTDPRGTRLRAVEQRYRLFGGEQEYSFLVAGNFDELSAEISAFTGALVLVLGLLGAGLLAAILVQVRFGLRPLRQLTGELHAVREGKSERLAGSYPAEVAPVAVELNLMLQANAQVIERARTQVGNLAHALKTPLSVLANEAHAERMTPLGAKVGEQVRLMGDQVSLYLDRARRAARAQGRGAISEVRPVLEALARTLQRIYAGRGLAIMVDCADALRFRGETQDLEEMAGNLLDNACKWASAAISVTVRGEGPDDSGRSWLVIEVSDDGPGLPPDRRAEALRRGGRLDETKPGSGLGLSIVAETAAMYAGALTLAESPAGGLAARLRLPAAIL